MSDLDAAISWNKKYDEIVDLFRKNHQKGRSLIHTVATLGRPDLIEAAMDMDYKTGALLNLRTGAHGWTPLHFAAQGGDGFIKALLKKEGIDINAKTTTTGQTALHIATIADKLSIVKLLLEHKISIECKDNDGKTALHAAAYKGHFDIVKMLLKHDAKIEARAKDGETALHLAAGQGKETVVRYLLEKKADASAKLTHGDKKGLTPRDLAVRKDYKDVVKLFK